jgi:hypothetical protein
MDKEKTQRNLQRRMIVLAARLANSHNYFEPIKVKKEFSLEQLVGKTIECRLKVGNPRPYNPAQSSPNPEFFDVLLFSDNTFMFSYSVGDGECQHTHFYYFDGKKLRKSSTLFDGY